MSESLFRRSYPEESYPLPGTSYTPAELIDEWRGDRQTYLMQVAASDIADFVQAGEIVTALGVMDTVTRLIRDSYASRNIVVDWDDPEYDLEGRINREVVRGVMTGIPGLDKQFAGFQVGSLICYLGRAKAGKTSLALLSAMHAWQMLDKRVLFVSFEIAAGKLPSEPGIADRLDCFGAGISLTNYMQGELRPSEEKLLREFRSADCDTRSFRIIQPTSRYTVTELEADIDDFQPDVVYVDGFYFMSDRITGKPGANWEGHDNIASDLKAIAMRRMIPVILTHQVREKQLSGKKGKGIDDQAMMGGTGIIMYADMVLGVDVDDSDPQNKIHTVSCTRSRLKYLDTVFGRWDWDDCTFTACESPDAQVDQKMFGYGNRQEEPVE